MRSPAVEWLYGLQHFGIKLGLHNIGAMLEMLGRPDRAYPVIHVAGTNGKGSVAAMLDGVLRAAGMRVGLFTSPHLVRPSERIRIDGVDLDERRFDAALFEMRDVLEPARRDGTLHSHPSFFEVMTATALQEFRRESVDVAVLEVGLGGRLDATNAADTDLSVIVTVDLDHTKSLGGTVEEIAFEKAGIIRAGVPVVTAVGRPEALGIIRAIAGRRGAPWIDGLAAATIEPHTDGSFAVVTAARRYDDLRPSLAGRHQWDNARLAIVALETIAPSLPRAVTPEAVVRGLARTRWPGRLQWIDGNPRMLLDGAHNPAGIAALVGHLTDHPVLPRPVLLFGTTREKDLDRVLGPLLPHVDGIVAGQAGIDRAMDPAVIVAWARERVSWIVAETDPATALARARLRAGDSGTVLVTGSLYLVGDILTVLDAKGAPGPVAM
jgi:dihydrofolate synthase/folylpolyglutamate synthase